MSTSNSNWGFGGSKGHRIIEPDFSATAGEAFFALQVVSEATITYVNSSGGDNASAKTFPAGVVIYGVFPASSVSVSSGMILGYVA